MTGASIGSGDGQFHIVGERAVGSGYGSKPSLPQHLRNFDPLAGAARGGVILPGSSTPLTQAEANFLNKHFDLHPTGPLPPNEDELGPFLAAATGLSYGVFGSWLRGSTAPPYLMRALMEADSHTLGVGLHDIARAFGAPGASNHDLIYRLTVWAQEYPGVRDVLDGVVLQMRDEGRIPANKKESA